MATSPNYFYETEKLATNGTSNEVNVDHTESTEQNISLGVTSDVFDSICNKPFNPSTASLTRA